MLKIAYQKYCLSSVLINHILQSDSYNAVDFTRGGLRTHAFPAGVAQPFTPINLVHAIFRKTPLALHNNRLINTPIILYIFITYL